jgi:hypothetical protein
MILPNYAAWWCGFTCRLPGTWYRTHGVLLRAGTENAAVQAFGTTDAMMG